VRSQYEPAVQVTGAARAGSGQKVPILHAVASALPDGQKVVALHCAGRAVVEPARHTKPASHGPVGADRPSNAQYAPGVHEIELALPIGQYLPTGHTNCVAVAEPSKQ
jgi:hypothetical protein